MLSVLCAPAALVRDLHPSISLQNKSLAHTHTRTCTHTSAQRNCSVCSATPAGLVLAWHQQVRELHPSNSLQNKSLAIGVIVSSCLFAVALYVEGKLGALSLGCAMGIVFYAVRGSLSFAVLVFYFYITFIPSFFLFSFSVVIHPFFFSLFAFFVLG
jgi:hypothetical protein